MSPSLPVMHADVAEPVELGPDLADLAGDELVVVDEPVVAERPAVGVPGMRTETREPNRGMADSYMRPSS